MQVYLLNLFFRFSGFTFNLKQKLVKAHKLSLVFPYAILLIISEIGFILISLPVYILVPPSKVQEDGFIFPKTYKEKPELRSYLIRRKITLTTIFGAGGIFLLKIAVIGLASFFIMGFQQLLADTEEWNFSVSGDYVYDSNKIEFVSGVAQLKNLGGLIAGNTTEAAFDAALGAPGWTYSDWLTMAKADGVRSATGGNPGAYGEITLNPGKNTTAAGYFQQAFTTTVNSPDIATLNLDWSSISLNVGATPDTYRLYAFIETAAGNPAGTSTAVWASPEITSATAWASIAPINIAANIPTAGTYYIKIAAYLDNPNTAYTGVSGFDNVIVNWSKTTVIYASDSPTTTPVTALSVPKAISWSAFSETATKNGGEIYYQLSDDNGSNWKWWTGSVWATTTSITDYNNATIVNSNIDTFATSTNQITWRAYLNGNGSQQVILDNVSITYTQNQLPSIQNLMPAQNIDYGYVNVDYNLQDTESDPSSLTAYEYSLDGSIWSTMTASTTDPAHSGVTSLNSAPAGVAHVYVWDAKTDVGNIYDADVYVRLRANDGIGNGAYATSSAFAIDYATSTVSNVVAVQNTGTTTVTVTYDLFDNTSDNILVEAQISGDGGSTWDIATSTLSGVGLQSSGAGKTITWAALTDYPNQQNSNLKIRIRAKDKFHNQGDYTSSANFSLDTLAPTTNAIVNLISQPLAGATSTLIGGSFTESNPNTNDFYLALNGGDYGTSTPGDTNTATPSNLNTNAEATLDGNDYISKVKIVHTDDYGLTHTNENTSPSTAYKYVKPYTPANLTLDNPLTNRLDLLINPHTSEAIDLQYAILETTQNKYVQSDGTLNTDPVWQTLGQWGTVLGINGKIRITGLTSPVSLYSFKVKSRNPSDAAHAASSESEWSAENSIPNTAPVIALDTYAQTTDGTQYTNINYSATDGQGDINNITVYEYSTDNVSWSTMTEKSGANSDGISSLVFLPSGSPYKFVWDSATNLPNIEDSTVYVRLRSSDTQITSNLATSGAFEIDNKLPVVSGVTASQDAGAKTVTIDYTLTDANNSLVQIEISSDGGSTWTVTTSSLSGAVGNNVTPGSKSVTWNAGTNFNDQYNTQMMVRVRARDGFGNQGAYVNSSSFTVDTNAPVISNVTAVQDTAAKTFTFNYDVSEDIGNATISLEISSDSGSTWTVPVTSASGDEGSVAPGTGKTITWDAATDFNNQEKTSMRIRITATDSFTNNSNLSSSDFSLDSYAPRITNVTALQTLATTTVVFNYDLADQNNSTIEIDISSDGGSTWTVTDTSVTGDIGTVSAGTGKTITWDALADFPNSDISNMRVRIRGTDTYSNASANVSSANFVVDTLTPAVNVTANLLAQPLAGVTNVLIGGSFSETNPNTNNFYVALNDGAYGSATAGTANTSTPANLFTATGATLDGNDYISQVKIEHTDDYGLSISNENNSPNSSYKYVKPYTPDSPTVDNPGIGTVDVLIIKNVAETDGLEYAIYESSEDKYVQANGTLGASPVWQTMGTGSGQWGQTSGFAGKISISGLTTHSYLYEFQVKSRNTSDSNHATTSESALSNGASSANQSPGIIIDDIGQSTSGSKYVTINYTGSDLESEVSDLITYEYSTNNSTWSTMTEKSGVGSDGLTDLSFAYPGTTHSFMWDVGTNLNNTEDSSVYVRLQANDGTSNGGLITSSSFAVDTKNPVVSSVTASQTVDSNNVVINYNLADLSYSTVQLEISSDGGSTWSVATSTATGDLGLNITPGSKTINWNPGTDYSGVEDSDVRVQIKATDNYGNAGDFVSSANFEVDTKSPVITNLVAAQNSGANTVAITYDISDAHNSNVAIDISSDGGSTWTVTDTSVSGAIGTGITPGTGKTITWSAGTDFPGWEIANMQVRIRATDARDNATGNISTANFTLDTKAPEIATVTAAQTLGSDEVSFTYSLADIGDVQIFVDISANSGSTWTVATTSLAGDVGSGVSAGSKSISWNAATDYNNQQNANMKVRVRGVDTFNNVSSNIELAGLFSLDTLAATVNASANLLAQPNAGDTAVLIGGSFTETNPNTNGFLVAINGGAYNATTTGEINTASPSNQNTAVGATLTGNDYISQVKIVHTDDFGHLTNNENNSPTSTYKFVKPYTPSTPTVNNPQNTSVDLTINPFVGENSAVEYLIYEVSTTQYVQSDGSLGVSPVWKSLGTAAGQWGNLSSVSGKVTVIDLNSPVASYSFMVKARNPSDTAHAVSSESAYSAVSGITNSAPNLSITSASQSLSGNYAEINYVGTDTQNDTNSLSTFEYSINGSDWLTMTEKSGVGSDGTSGLIFNATGTNYMFAWDVATDLPNQEQTTVYVRLQSTDTLTNSNLETSSAFYTDTKGPIVSGLVINQAPGSNLVTFEYDLSDSAITGNNISLDISSDNGSTYTLATSSLSGDIINVSSGDNRTITWDASVDFSGQESSTLAIRVHAADRYSNLGAYATSTSFTVDAKSPVVSSVTANQTLGTNNVVINYNLSDLTTAGHLVEFEISNDSGASWTVATTTYSGDMGAGQTTGSKSFTWLAGTDYLGYDLATMRTRVRAKDYFANQGIYSTSTDFALDTLDPVISNLTASQTASTTTVVIDYDIDENATTTIDISSDGGSTWTVAKSTLTGDFSYVTAGSKSISWNAAVDYGNQENSNMRVRLNGLDEYGNISNYFESSNFAVDTAAPLGLLSLNEYASTPTSASLNWESNTDANFSHYELWHGNNLVDVNNRTGSSTKWSVAQDANLSNESTITTVITGINLINNYYVKIWAVDDFGNYVTVPAINVYAAPVISNISASQVGGLDNVTINYDLVDTGDIQILLDISSDSGSTWSVATSTLTGDIGNGVTQGTAKSVTWNAGTDYNGQQTGTMKVRLQGIDSSNNTSVYFELPGTFSLDTLAAATNILTNLKAQPLAGDNVALLGGSFTETNPNTNNYYLAINGGSYGSATAGDTNTASPADKETAVGANLTGHDYISKVSLVHVDDFGHSTTNENTSPNVVFKYVKPYTPAAPLVNGATTSTVDVTINPHVSEASDVEYLIYEISTDQYVQANGSLGTSEIWQVIGTGASQWGNTTSVNGKITVTGLTPPVADYSFSVKSRNPSDTSYATTSESIMSSSASSANQAPVVTINSAAQTTDGSKYVTINYTGSDYENETSSLANYQYSTDNSNWFSMTEKSGVGSDGTTGLGFTTAGANFDFMWDINTDLANTEDSTVYVRLRANDDTVNGAYAVSSAFAIDTQSPTTAAVTASQTNNSNNVVINYNLTSSVNSLVELEISGDSGSTWNLATTTAIGHLGTNVVAGTGKIISWNPGVDYANQEDNDLQVRIRATDNFGNQSNFVASSDFSVDTKSPALTNVSASQNTSNNTVVITYDLSDANNSTVAIDISSDGGTTWNVTDTTVSGAIGAGVTPGTNKTIIWTAETDFPEQEIANMRIRVNATDNHANSSGNVESGDFGLNTISPTPPVVLATSAGAPIILDIFPPVQPILNLLLTPTRETLITISGLAEPRSRVELYDNDSLVSTLISLADNNGVFSQQFEFVSGDHLLTVRAIDSANNASPISSAVQLSIISTIPTAPIILTPQNNTTITNPTPQIIGISDPNNTIIINVDDAEYTVISNNDGAWNLILPSSASLGDGEHTITAIAIDATNIASPITTSIITKTTTPIITPVATPGLIPEPGEITTPGVPPVTVEPTETTPIETIVSIPSQVLIRETTEATEVPGIPTPSVRASEAAVTAQGDIISFTGTSLPNFDVVAYIHSDQALIYRTRTDEVGNWRINHSQTAAELSPGEHTIYAVALDTNAKVKSRPSTINSFVVEKNFWVMIFNYLNWPTTAATLAILILILFWLRHLRKQKK